MAEQIQIIETKNWKGRLILILMMLAALIFGWLSISWQIGNMLAALTSSNQPNAGEIADLAHSLSPRDPITNWLKANVEKELFTDESPENTVKSMEEAVRYAPEDYRYWLELGRAYEQTENFEKAEKAFGQAVEVAPNYSNVHWQIGNYYLRRGDDSKAFPALRKSAETSANYREQVFSVVWDYFDNDKTKLDELAGNMPDMYAGLAKFYAGKQLPEDSLKAWNTLSDADKMRNQDIARLIAQALFDKGYFRSAIEFVRQLGIEQVESETVVNGGFESPIAVDLRESFFGWKFWKKDKVDINTDPTKKKEGTKSLRFTFNGFTGIEIKNLMQLVTVQPTKKYRLTFWLKTEELKSGGNPLLMILNANDQKIITTSPPFPTGTQDWTLQTVEFTAPPNAEAVALVIDRAYCGETCPIVGTFWFDDFKIERIN